MNVFEVIVKVLPIALQVVPLIERMFGDKPGSEKREAAIDLIKPTVRAIESATGKELVDEEELANAAGCAVDGVVGVLNSTGVFKKDK